MFTKFALSVGAILILVALGCGSPAFPILFTSDTDGNLEIYSINANGEKLTNLTNTRTHEFAPVVSPNRRLVSFLSGVQGDTAVEVMRIDGTGRSRLTLGSAEHSSQRWSPSNDRIAYVKNDGANSNIYMTLVSEEKTTLLTSIAGYQVGGWSSAIVNSKVLDTWMKIIIEFLIQAHRFTSGDAQLLMDFQGVRHV